MNPFQPFPRPSSKTLLPVLGLTILAALGADRPADAQAFTVTTTGTVLYKNGDGADPFGPTVSPGTPFTCTFTWDRAIPVSTSSAVSTRWASTDRAYGATVSVGAVSVAPAAAPLIQFSSFIQKNDRHGQVLDDVFMQAADEVATGTSLAQNFVTVQVSRYNRNTSPPVFVNLSDPGANWLDPWDVSEVDLIYTASQSLWTVTMSVTNVTGTGLTPAPEPSPSAALTVGALGLAGLAVRRRRARRGAQ